MVDPLPAFTVSLPNESEAQCTVIGVYAVQQSLVRHVPHYRLSSPLAFDLKVAKSHKALGEHQYRVELSVAVSLRQDDGIPALSAAVTLEAVVVAVGLDAAALDYQMTRALPARLYSHARVHIEALTRDSGYVPLTLPPASLEPGIQQEVTP